MSEGNSWFVAQTQPQRERWAAENVLRQGFEYYAPRTEEIVVRRGRKIRNLPYLFPRYLFIKTDGRWRSLTGTLGISCVIMQGDRPAVMPETAIQQLRSRENAEGLILLSKKQEARFNPGDAVRISDGPFSGYNGVWEGMSGEGRAKVLLEFLGQKTRLLLGDESLEAV